MKAEEARAILQRHNLINRKTSKKILSAITLRRELDPSEIPDARLFRIAEDLKCEYWNIRESMPELNRRNAPFYHIIRNRYADFDWKEVDDKTIIDFKFEGLKPSLLSLLTGIVPSDRNLPTRQHHALERLPEEVASGLQHLLEKAGVVQPAGSQWQLLVDWLRRGLDGAPLTIVSPVCPDYEVEDGDAAQHRFTFQGLGTGIGVTAKRLFESLPMISRFLRDELDLSVTHYVCPGDFEGFSAETSARLGIDEATFLERLERSRQSILAQAPAPVRSCFFTDLCGGKRNWEELYADVLAQLASGKLGPVAGTAWLRRVATGRRGLYDRWYDVQDQPPAYYEQIAIRQGAEYAAMAMAISQCAECPNPLVLGADDHKMSVFYRLGAELPVLYLQRNYE